MYSKNFHTNNGRTLDLALENYNEAIKIEPNHPVGHSNAGSIYFKMKKYDLAIEEYLLVLPQWSNHTGVYINLVVSYIYQNRREEAIEIIKKALNKCEDFAKELCKDSESTIVELAKFPSVVGRITLVGVLLLLIYFVLKVKNKLPF
jgi:tetratricopeptide (TPR) repeat protein